MEIAGRNEVVLHKKRIASIDILRGLVMLLMTVDHVRERFFYHLNVSDPMDIDTTSPQLFFTRITAHFCAPVFVFLTGLSAWLYANPPGKSSRSATGFLFKRGVFIIFIEIAVINWLWSGTYQTLWLQVMWAIGISMVFLSLLSKLPAKAILLLGFTIVFGHNLLSPITFDPSDTGYALWSFLHQKGFIYTSEVFRIKISYPVLPWIGVILLGFSMGPVYAQSMQSQTRKKVLLTSVCSMWMLLILLRSTNFYGEPNLFEVQENTIQTVMSFINFTKYPPSLDFLLFTLAGAFLVLYLLENVDNRLSKWVETFGSAPMFYYIVHLTVLLVSYRVALAIMGPNYGDMLVFGDLWQVWFVAAILVCLLYVPTKAFSAFKRQSKNPLIKYF
ncbi:DUF1624 domain-containing protein [Aestuariibacter sp. GS-14]|uniref:DUF1624 domain-containing protein n=1 Tax=Aestuariibacter sp. GS-14 TaxID=2590670 RepID=UPI001126AA63|nr:heparan-alpha-glucosaminide N-acetyltransferase domain-containing protein [Aestuariibacter sp. GS-14]TPV59978.1 DUF1624 domain-containing protein [Aestuariibacter sp. GS-14]